MLFKLLLTVLATSVLLIHMPTVSFLADGAVATDRAPHDGLTGELLHTGGGLVVLLVATVLSVVKPRGMTPYGWRMQHEQCTVSPAKDGTT